MKAGAHLQSSRSLFAEQCGVGQIGALRRRLPAGCRAEPRRWTVRRSDARSTRCQSTSVLLKDHQGISGRTLGLSDASVGEAQQAARAGVAGATGGARRAARLCTWVNGL